MRRMPVEFDHPRWGTVRTVLYLDPAPRHLDTIVRASAELMVRGVCHDGVVAVFDAAEASHLIVRDVLGWPAVYERTGGGTDFWIVADGMEPGTGDWEAGDDDLVVGGLRLIVGGTPDELHGTGLYGYFASPSSPKPPGSA